MQRVWIGLGALAGLTAVAMAAVAAHGLGGLDPAALAMVRSGIEMQGWHALALLACGLWAPRSGKLADWAGAAFALGIGGVRLGVTAPIGGTLLMLGWLLLGLSALFARRTP